MTESGEAEWIDVSVTVRHGMAHWPDNPPIVMQRAMDIEAPARAILRPVPGRPPAASGRAT